MNEGGKEVKNKRMRELKTECKCV